MSSPEVRFDRIPDAAFVESPFPMWVFDQETLAFLDVNQTAIERYGYSREEFLKMTILDIRPTEDVPQLLHETLDPGRAGPSEKELWRHKGKDGVVFSVEITSWEITFRSRPAELVQVREIIL